MKTLVAFIWDIHTNCSVSIPCMDYCHKRPRLHLNLKNFIGPLLMEPEFLTCFSRTLQYQQSFASHLSAICPIPWEEGSHWAPRMDQRSMLIASFKPCNWMITRGNASGQGTPRTIFRVLQRLHCTRTMITEVDY